MNRYAALCLVFLSVPAALFLDACGSDAAGVDIADTPDGAARPDGATPGSDGSAVTDASGGNDSAARDGSSGDGGGGGEGGLPLVKINEIFINTNLAAGGDSIEWVELWGPPGTSLDDLKLRLIYRGDAGVKYEVDVAEPGHTLGTGNNSYWVVGGQFSTGIPNQPYMTNVWGLDEVGAIQLVKLDNGVRTPIDVVGYGGAVPPLASSPTATAEGTPVTYAGIPTRSIGRKKTDAGVPQDTGDNSADFCEQNLSFGTVNGDCQ